MRYSLFSVNDHYPKLPRTVPQLYAQVMRHCELAETLGYDTFFCAEHHFHEYGVVPDPAVMLSALAQRKKHVYEDIIANDINLFGSVETVAEKLTQLHATGIRHVATMHNFGALDPALVERSMTLFAREVMPAVRDYSRAAMTGA